MIGMAKGMVVTLRHMLSPAFTADYPWKKPDIPERSRISFEMPLGADGTPLCKACMLCDKNCPMGAITIISEKREDGPGRVLEKFSIDLGLCMYCGICVENCASGALSHAGDFETATADKDSLHLVLYEASQAGRTTQPVASETEARE